jgi:hypothetical protein
VAPRRLTIACAIVLIGCSSDGDAGAAREALGSPQMDVESRSDAGPRTCDPLAAETEPATLGTVIAVGRAADGTLYVGSSLSSTPSIDRVFVSEGGALQRRSVLGSGTQGGSLAGDSDYTASFQDGGAESRLVIKRRADAVVGVALVHDSGRSFFDALPSGAAQLEIVDAREIQGLPLKNIPGTITVEIVADAPDGSQLVLTRPTVDWSYEDFRLYYGRDGKLIERVVKNASRGSNTYLTFVVDGQDYDVVFANAFLSPNTSSTLRGNGSTQELTLAAGTPHLPEGATFTCLR